MHPEPWGRTWVPRCGRGLAATTNPRQTTRAPRSGQLDGAPRIEARMRMPARKPAVTPWSPGGGASISGEAEAGGGRSVASSLLRASRGRRRGMRPRLHLRRGGGGWWSICCQQASPHLKRERGSAAQGEGGEDGFGDLGLGFDRGWIIWWI